MGVNFGSRDFLGFGFLPSFDHARHLNPEYSPGVGELNFEISDIGLGFKSESRIRSPPPGDLGLSFFTRRMCNAGGVLNPG